MGAKITLVYSKLLIMAVKQIALVLDLIGFTPLGQITMKGRKLYSATQWFLNLNENVLTAYIVLRR